MKKQPKQDMVQLGAMGGQATLKKKGARFFARISRKRKNFKGGRPPKTDEARVLNGDKPRPSKKVQE
jgi:hypothetical protein